MLSISFIKLCCRHIRKAGTFGFLAIVISVIMQQSHEFSTYTQRLPQVSDIGEKYVTH